MIIIGWRVGMCVCNVYDDGVIDLCILRACVRVYIYIYTHIQSMRNGMEEMAASFSDRRTRRRRRNAKSTIGEKDYRQQLRSCAVHTHPVFSLFSFSLFYLLLSLSLLFPFKTWPQLISSSVIQPPLVSLPFSLLTLSVFGWWPVLEALPKAAFLHLLSLSLSRLRSVVLLLFSFRGSSLPSLSNRAE